MNNLDYPHRTHWLTSHAPYSGARGLSRLTRVDWIRNTKESEPNISSISSTLGSSSGSQNLEAAIGTRKDYMSNLDTSTNCACSVYAWAGWPECKPCAGLGKFTWVRIRQGKRTPHLIDSSWCFFEFWHFHIIILSHRSVESICELRLGKYCTVSRARTHWQTAHAPYACVHIGELALWGIFLFNLAHDVEIENRNSPRSLWVPITYCAS